MRATLASGYWSESCCVVHELHPPLPGPRNTPVKGTHKECSLSINYNLAHTCCNHMCLNKTHPVLVFISWSAYVNHRLLASTLALIDEKWAFLVGTLCRSVAESSASPSTSISFVLTDLVRSFQTQHVVLGMITMRNIINEWLIIDCGWNDQTNDIFLSFSKSLMTTIKSLTISCFSEGLSLFYDKN